jgi:hypothetical protein
LGSCVIEEDHDPAPAVAVQEIEHIPGPYRQCIRKEKVDMMSVVCGIDKGTGGSESGGPLFVRQESARALSLACFLSISRRPPLTPSCVGLRRTSTSDGETDI